MSERKSSQLSHDFFQFRVAKLSEKYNYLMHPAAIEAHREEFHS